MTPCVWRLACTHKGDACGGWDGSHGGATAASLIGLKVDILVDDAEHDRRCGFGAVVARRARRHLDRLALAADVHAEVLELLVRRRRRRQRRGPLRPLRRRRLLLVPLLLVVRLRALRRRGRLGTQLLGNGGLQRSRERSHLGRVADGTQQRVVGVEGNLRHRARVEHALDVRHRRDRHHRDVLQLVTQQLAKILACVDISMCTITHGERLRGAPSPVEATDVVSSCGGPWPPRRPPGSPQASRTSTIHPRPLSRLM